MRTYEVRLVKSAEKELADLPRPDQRRITDKLAELRTNPRPGDCRKLRGSQNTYRVRAGVYRVVYEVHDDRVLVLVVRIRHRKDVYRGL